MRSRSTEDGDRREGQKRLKAAKVLCVGTGGLGAPLTLYLAVVPLGFLLWQVGFMTIGGEWFGMWQSQQWNGVPSAFRFVMTIIAVLIFVAIPDQELERGGTA